MTTITIPKRITHGKDLIIIPREDYEKLLGLSKKIRKVKIKSELDRGLDEALKEVREGKTFGPFKTAEEGIKFLDSDKT